MTSPSQMTHFSFKEKCADGVEHKLPRLRDVIEMAEKALEGLPRVVSYGFKFFTVYAKPEVILGQIRKGQINPKQIFPANRQNLQDCLEYLKFINIRLFLTKKYVWGLV